MTRDGDAMSRASRTVEATVLAMSRAMPMTRETPARRPLARPDMACTPASYSRPGMAANDAAMMPTNDCTLPRTSANAETKPLTRESLALALKSASVVWKRRTMPPASAVQRANAPWICSLLSTAYLEAAHGAAAL
jgi:hypothetical protein